jgi:hypothetical protein
MFRIVSKNVAGYQQSSFGMTAMSEVSLPWGFSHSVREEPIVCVRRSQPEQNWAARGTAHTPPPLRLRLLDPSSHVVPPWRKGPCQETLLGIASTSITTLTAEQQQRTCRASFLKRSPRTTTRRCCTRTPPTPGLLCSDTPPPRAGGARGFHSNIRLIRIRAPRPVSEGGSSSLSIRVRLMGREKFSRDC